MPYAILTASGHTWTPSHIKLQWGRGRGGREVRRPSRPGERWWRGDMALYKWVIKRAPEVTPERPSEKVADVWPREGTMLC